MNRLSFPVLAIKNQVVHVYHDDDALSQCSRTALSNGWFKNLILIDAELRRFTVRHATKVGTVGALWGFDVFLNQRLRVSLQLVGLEEKLSLEQVKGMLQRAIDADPGHWESGGELNRIREQVDRADGYLELIDILDR